MRSPLLQLSLPFSLTLLVGCQFHARSAEDYEKDTRALLETKAGQIKQCYDSALTQDKAAQGAVGIRFVVQKETGVIADAAVDPALTTAPEALGQCVVDAINGLTLTPPDERDGEAVFVYQFTINEPPPAG